MKIGDGLLPIAKLQVGILHHDVQGHSIRELYSAGGIAGQLKEVSCIRIFFRQAWIRRLSEKFQALSIVRTL